jgi:hypothetical protein
MNIDLGKAISELGQED